MRVVNYPFKVKKKCYNGALFLWQLQHFMIMGRLINRVFNLAVYKDEIIHQSVIQFNSGPHAIQELHNSRPLHSSDQATH